MDPEDEEIELQNGVEIEGQEQDIAMQNELIAVGKVNSVNGKTGDVILTTSDLENDSDYQTGSEVESAISEAVAEKQDKLTAGDNITIENNVISASDTTYTAGNGLSLNNENEFSVDTTVVATQQNLATEVTNRENADNALQAQIDGIAASSDVVDIVGTYAELQSYDTQHLKDNDIIKVLQDETQNDATTYYRWSTATESFTLIGQEGPYYTKAAADAQFVPQTRTVNSKALSSNITLTASDVSAVASSDVVQVTGSNTTKIMSQKATTDALGLKLNISDYVVDTALADSTNPVQNKVLYGLFGSMPSDFFTGPVTVNGNGRDITLTGTMNAKLNDVKMYGDTFQQTYSGKNLWNNAQVESVSDYVLPTATGLRLSKTANGRITPQYSISLSANTTYTISCALAHTTEQSNLFCQWKTEDNTTLWSPNIGDGTTTFTPNKNIVGVIFYIQAPETDGTYVEANNLMIEQGSATAYEPYVGGTASPNPDYPQDVQTVTGTQTVGVSGKNLFDKNGGNILNTALDANGLGSNVPSSYRAIYVECQPNTKYTVSKTKDTTKNRFAVGYTKTTPTYNMSDVYGTTVDNAASSITITTGADANYLVAYVWISNGSVTADDMVASVQVEKGTATTYEPYQGASYTVRLGSLELCKIGNYQDYIYKSGDDWYVHKAIQKTVLSSVNGEQNSAFIWYASPSALESSVVGTIIVASDFYLGQGTNFRDGIGNFRIAKVLGANQQIGIKDNRFANYTEFNTWLANNNLTLYYVLATATDTKITNADLISDLNALWNTLSYDGQTNFAITASGLSGILDVTAFKKTLAGLIGAINR